MKSIESRHFFRLFLKRETARAERAEFYNSPSGISKKSLRLTGFAGMIKSIDLIDQ